MLDIRFDGQARCEYFDALDWYVSKGGRVGANFDAAFHRAIDAIRAMPELYGLIDDQHRWCPIKKSAYGLVYRVTAGQAVVVGVAHARQRPADWGSRG